MDRQVGADELVFLRQSQADRGAQHAVDDESARECPGNAERGACELRAEADAATPAERRLAEEAGRDAAPGAAQAVQRPDAEDVVDPPAVLRQRELEKQKTAEVKTAEVKTAEKKTAAKAGKKAKAAAK